MKTCQRREHKLPVNVRGSTIVSSVLSRLLVPRRMGKKVGMSMHVATYDSVEIKVGVKNKLVWLFHFFFIKKT